MRWNCMSKALRFLQITAKPHDFPFLTVFLTVKTSSQTISIKLLQILLKLCKHREDRIGEKSSCERFCKVASAENFQFCWSNIGGGVISMLWQLWCHCNLEYGKFLFTVVAIFPNFCLWRRTWYWPWKLYRATFIRQYVLCCCNMAPVSFRLFCKNLGHLREFFGQMVYRPPPGKKFSVRLCT